MVSEFTETKRDPIGMACAGVRWEVRRPFVDVYQVSDSLNKVRLIAGSILGPREGLRWELSMTQLARTLGSRRRSPELDHVLDAREANIRRQITNLH